MNSTESKPYPIPQLEKTLTELKTVYRQLSSEIEYSKFENLLSNATTDIEKDYQKVKASVENKANWSTEMFQQNLLSLRSPIPLSTAISAILQPINIGHTVSQVEQASMILEAIATIFVNPSMLQANPGHEKTQQKNMFATCRIPKKGCDELINFSDSRHAILISKGIPYAIDILDVNRQPIDYSILQANLFFANINAILNKHKNVENFSICDYTGLNRDKWAEYRNQILQSSDKAEMDIFQSAIITVILEDFDLNLENPIEAYETLQSGKIRNFDQTTNIVVYRNAVTGIICDHSAVDGLILTELAGKIREVCANLHKDSKETILKPSSVRNPLLFNLEVIDAPEVLKKDETIAFFDFDLFPDISSLLKEQKLFDAWIVLVVQIALKQIFENEPLLVAVPTHVRHFIDGRCDSTYINNEKINQFFDYLKTINPVDLLNNPHLSQIGLKYFFEALNSLKTKIRDTKCGNAFGTHVAIIRRMLDVQKHSELKNMLEMFAAPAVVITGAQDVKEDIFFGTGNIYAANQICINYLGGKSDVRITLRASGTYKDKLDHLQKYLQGSLKIMQIFAVQTGIINQMGAAKILLQPSPSPPADSDPKFTLAIHGGAGEMTALMPEMIGIVKFALHIAILIGINSFHQNGNVVDAVEAVTKALEDCFIFNAGKGSVFNAKGEHELEASIMDGTSGKAGAVAGIKKLKNPISAAAKVMKECNHVFLHGNAAEEFCGNLEKVEQKYFDTDLRKQQWEVVKNEMMKQESTQEYPKTERCQMSAPQTVGAVAVDGNGRLAAATSTGGLINKMEGRIGDSAVIGAATWADKNVAVSCTGDGEEFLRKAVASKIAFTYDGNLSNTCNKILKNDMKNALAGIVAVDSKGDIVGITNAQMFFGSFKNGKITTEIVKSKDNDETETTKVKS